MTDYQLLQQEKLSSLVSDFRNTYNCSDNQAELSARQVSNFQDCIYCYYNSCKRTFPWRNTQNEYYIVVSEIMLQQTQTDRVAEKYDLFIEAFPTIHKLAEAPLSSVLEAWQGLGYNRRAKFLHQLAQKVVNEFNGKIPQDPDTLLSLPGIGKATAASISAFAFNKPVIFIETNIRSVFIHFFFNDKHEINDNEILPLLEQTLDRKRPYDWYSALMDVGAMLKKMYPNPNRKSSHYTKQSKFEGSNRQLRGQIIRVLLDRGTLTLDELTAICKKEKAVLTPIISQLCTEGLVAKQKNKFSIV